VVKTVLDIADSQRQCATNLVRGGGSARSTEQQPLGEDETSRLLLVREAA
jgi:hypothetical protein